MRSNGVKKWRRLLAGSAFGPSGGSFASEAAFVALETLVRPSVRSVNWYAPATFIGPDTLSNFAIAVPFAAWSIENFSTSGFLKYFVFVQRYVPLSPTRNGKYDASGGGACATWFVDCNIAVV